jgi:uncharacterized membrane protein YqaE (UPF0057 family)
MNQRIFSMMLLLLLGVWHAALAFSPGGEEKGVKSRDSKHELIVRAPAGGEAMAAERLAENLIHKGISDESSSASVKSNVAPHQTGSNSHTALSSVLDQRVSEQSAMLSRKEMRQTIKTQIRAARKQGRNLDRPAAPFADDMLIICVLLAILFPPLGIAIWEDGITSHFWIGLLLTILFYLPGLIYAIYIITQ